MSKEDSEYNLENRLKSEFDLGLDDLKIIQNASLNDEAFKEDENQVRFTSKSEKEKKVIDKVRNVTKILSTVSNEMSDILKILHATDQQLKQGRVQACSDTLKDIVNMLP